MCSIGSDFISEIIVNNAVTAITTKAIATNTPNRISITSAVHLLTLSADDFFLVFVTKTF